VGVCFYAGSCATALHRGARAQARGGEAGGRRAVSERAPRLAPRLRSTVRRSTCGAPYGTLTPAPPQFKAKRLGTPNRQADRSPPPSTARDTRATSPVSDYGECGGYGEEYPDVALESSPLGSPAARGGGISDRSVTARRPSTISCAVSPI
jgi:hypothetical protein